MAVTLRNTHDYPASRAATLAAELADLTTLERVLGWAAPRAIAEVVTQDEYTHDVVIPLEQAWWLVFDVT